MRKDKWLWTPLVILSIALISTAACNESYLTDKTAAPATTPAPNDEGLLPLIESFTISPVPAIDGQAITLSWNTTDASSVTIKPEVGSVEKVDLSGTKQLTPPRSMTYTLIAKNTSGTVTSAKTVILVPPPGMPELVITHMWSTGQIMYFNVKNAGTGISTRCNAYLYLNAIHVATANVQPLAPGEQRIEEFPNYAIPNNPPGGYTLLPVFQWDYKVCIDAETQIVESEESNNCTERIFGQDWGVPPWGKDTEPLPSQLDFNIFPDIQTSITTQ